MPQFLYGRIALDIGVSNMRYALADLRKVLKTLLALSIEIARGRQWIINI